MASVRRCSKLRCVVNVEDNAPLTALWQRYLRGVSSHADFIGELAKLELGAAGAALDAYRMLKDEPVGGQRTRHQRALVSFAEQFMARDPARARAALRMLVERDLAEQDHWFDLAVLDAYCDEQLDDYTAFLAIVARYGLVRRDAEQLLTRAATTLTMLAALKAWDCSSLRHGMLIVESACHPLVVHLAVQRCAPRQMVFESALEQELYAGLGEADTNLDEIFALNSVEEIECYGGVEQITSALLTACLSSPTPCLPLLRELLESNRFAIEDSLYAASKRAASLCHLLAGDTSRGPALLLLAQGRLLHLLASSGRSYEKLSYFWCHRRLNQQRCALLHSFNGTLSAPSVISCPAAVLKALDALLVAASPRQRLKQRVKALLPSAAVGALRMLFNVFARLRHMAAWRPRPSRAFEAEARRRILQQLDAALLAELQSALQRYEMPLDILFFTTFSPIYLHTVRDLAAHTDARGLQIGVVIRNPPAPVPQEIRGRTLDYFELLRTPPVRPLYAQMTTALTSEIRRLKLGELLRLPTRHGLLDLNYSVSQSIDFMLTAALLRSHAFELLLAELFEVSSPRRVVVAPDRVPEALAAIRHCRARGVPSWAVQTVYHSRHPRYKPLQADYTSLIDSWSYRLFRDHFAVDSARLFVTGSPRMHLNIAAEQAAPRRQLLFVCQRGVPFNLANLDYVLRNLDGLRDELLVVRPHPSESTQQARAYQALLERYPQQRALIDGTRPLREVMLEARIVLVAYSNVGLEAACYGIPVVIINPARIDYPVAMDEMGIGHAVHSDAELQRTLQRLGEDREFRAQLARAQRSYLDHNAHLLRGDATQRILDLIVAEPPRINDDGARHGAHSTPLQ